ncbi:TPA: hypothetical protein MYL00_004147 [Klebsiella pneumoniae]|nr:hypothetical protein [Klebsiella pneumoniae]
MTDITKLAHGNSLRKKLNRRLNDAYGFQRTSGGKHTTISLSIAECKSVIAALDERLALVESLEKAQRANAAQDDHINQQQDRIDQLEKGHQEAAKQINSWRRMAKQNIAEREKDIAELDAARQRIAELESRTVKLPDDEDDQAYGFGKWANRKLPATAGAMTIAYCEDAWRAAFEVFSSAAGIKVEAE